MRIATAPRTVAGLLSGGVLLLLLPLAQAVEPTRIDPAAFGDFEGCALFVTRDRYKQVERLYRPESCRTPRSPCSTFKIPHALIGLQTGVIDGPGHLIAWDGVVRDRQVLNQDHDLASAVHHSVVWYFRALAERVGAERMQHWIDRLGYGNRDLSGGIDGFWLSSSLQIDGHGQLELIRKLWRGALPFDPEVQADVRAMLRQDGVPDGALYGKTGSCRGQPENGIPDHGWFIGWVDWETRNPSKPSTTWFVVNIVGDDAWGSRARDIALELLEHPSP